MYKENLAKYNLGENLDNLMNLDPRGYGVCRILYDAARKYTKKPLTINAAQKLVDEIKEGDLVYIITGFVLPSHKEAESDGIISSLFLARSLVKAFNAKPVIVCQEENLTAVRNLSFEMGLHLYDSIENLKKYPISIAVVPFTKDINKADQMAEDLIKQGTPKAVISIEHPGKNQKNIYHNSLGIDCTELEAKTDILFEKLVKMGVLNIAIGDLGNEIGMGTIANQVKQYIPYANLEDPSDNIGAVAKTDNIITATVSDWGCNGLMAAIAYLKKDLDVFHDGAMQKEAMKIAARSGMNDMTGWLLPAIDGFGIDMNVYIVNLMREIVKSTLEHDKKSAVWFEKVEERGYFNDKIREM